MFGRFSRIRRGIAIGAQKGFAGSWNLLCDILEGIEGEDGIEVAKEGTRWKIRKAKGESLGASSLSLPRPFDLDMSVPSQIAVNRAIVTTGYMVSGDTFPIMRTVEFDAPTPIPCSSLSSRITLWYLMTQVESELLAGTSTNCMLSVDPDGDDPDRLLFRIPLYVLNITSTVVDEVSVYQYTVEADLRNSTLVRLS